MHQILGIQLRLRRRRFQHRPGHSRPAAVSLRPRRALAPPGRRTRGHFRALPEVAVAIENPEVDAAMATPDATPESTVEGSQEEEEQEGSEGHEKSASAASSAESKAEVIPAEISESSVKSQDSEQEQGKEKKDEDQESIISSLLCDTEPRGDSPRTPGRVLAFVRVKPTAHFAQDMIRLGADNKSIDIYLQKSPRGGVVNNSQTDWSFKLDGLLHNTSQEVVYETVAKDLVSKALQGYNGTIMCYGQTGAGKTYTMTGTASEYRNRGIIPRAIQQIFKSAAEFLNILVTVRISYLEIYNEALFDLLAPALGRGCKDNQLAVMDGPQGVYVKGLSIHPVSHEEEALHLLFEGETNRVIGEHSLNKNSSRSHCIFTMYIECRSRDYTNHKCLRSKITLIDLAGSERLSKTGSEGQVRVEAAYINKSLSFLEQLIIALADPKREHIPFRQSKLTHVLKDSLGGKCDTVLVTNIYGEAEHVEETLSSLRFATRMNWVTAEPVPNEPFYREPSVKALEEEIQLLKQELVMQDNLTSHSLMTYNPLTTAQRAEIRSQVQKYLRGVIEEIDIVNVRQIQEVFRQFKVILSQQEEELESRLWNKYGLGQMAGSDSDSSFDSDLRLEEAEEQEEEQEGTEGPVGQDSDSDSDDDAGTIEIGSPPSSPIPDGEEEADEKERIGSPPPETGQDESSSSKSPTKDQEEEEGEVEEEEDEEEKEKEPEEGDDQDNDDESSVSSSEESQDLRPSLSKEEAFEVFKKETGREIHKIFRENKRILIAKKKGIYSVAQRMNSLKEQIEGIKEDLEAEKRKRRQEGEYTDKKGQVIIDEKEFSLIVKLKQLKEEHRAGFSELQDLKTEIQYCQHLVDKCRKRLISEFEIWYNENFRLPKDVKKALEVGGNIRPGMIPINKVLGPDEDQQDKFERVQEAMLPHCPGSLSFYRARMKIERKQTFSSTMAALQKMHRKPGLVPAAEKKKTLSFLPII
ncbi:LOW QUALITY PROTEIN: kinesin-like protein KIF9 [Motacilla alba alba]|uniref:LOW QUALITY PROTEIN: kinesin-like protein KIF9 n=1 Tax=Motacilla alba alba TaxID=1094192 RepID=UPI0018D4F385|nr:LOW QUALITY PROTEIN: kinesin-like protein KIF9 [Motacilla alba alba]